MANIHKFLSSYLFSVKENRFCYDEAAPTSPAGAPPSALPVSQEEPAESKAAREAAEKAARESAEKAAAESRRSMADAPAKQAIEKQELSEAEKVTLKAREVAKKAEDAAKQAEDVANKAGMRAPDESKEETKGKTTKDGYSYEGIFNKDDVLIEGTSIELSDNTVTKGIFDDYGNQIEGTFKTKDFTKKGKWDEGGNLEGTFVNNDGVTLKGKFEGSSKLLEGIIDAEDKTQEGTFEHEKDKDGNIKFKRVLQGTITFKKHDKVLKIERDKDNSKIFFKDKRVYEGKYPDDKGIRVGIITYLDGHKEEGKWDEDWKPIEAVKTIPAGAKAAEPAPAPAPAKPADKPVPATVEDDNSSEDADADATPESKEVPLKGKLDVYALKDLLKKEAKIDATPDEIKKAFKYYQLDGKARGYIKGTEKKKTEEILNGISKLVKEEKIKPEQLAYIGSVDGTKYLMDKVLKQTQKWHEEKRDALEVLLGFIGNNTVIFEPNDKKPDTATQELIKQYILKVGSDLDAAKQLVTDHQDKFLLAQGIFNMALAVQRARNIKARVFDDENSRLDSSKDVIRIELGTDEDTDADRKSGLLLLEQDNPIKPFLRDDDIPKDESEPEPQDGQDKADQPPAQGDSGEPPVEEKKPKKQKERKAAEPDDEPAEPIKKPKKPKKAEEKEEAQQQKEAQPNKFHERRLDEEKYIWVVFKDKNEKERGYRFMAYKPVPRYPTITPEQNGAYINVAIDNVNIDLDFSKPQGRIPFAHTNRGFLEKYDMRVEGKDIKITAKEQAPSPAPAPQQESAKETWGPVTQKIYPNGGFEKGQYSADGKKFKGIDINNEGIVTTGLWEKNSAGEWINIKESDIKRYPNQDECLKNIELRTKDLGINITIWNGRSYDFRDLWKNTLNVIAGIAKASPIPKELGIILNQNWALPVFRYTTQGLDKLSNGKRIIVIDYWDSSEKITKTIKKAVEDYKKSIADKSSEAR